MLIFEEFADEIKKEVAGLMGSGYEVAVRKVPKNNGIKLTGLVIRKKGERVSPAIYLNRLYQLYVDEHGNVSLKYIADLVVDIFRAYEQEPQKFPGGLDWLTDYGSVRDKIIFRLINTEANQELLTQVPSIPFQDLSIVFMLYIEENEDDMCVSFIHNEHLACWNVTRYDIYKEAVQNTPRLLPEIMTGLDEIMKRLANNCMYSDSQDDDMEQSETEKSPFYVLTNRAGIGGAACLLYPDVMKKCADRLESDLLILPSSVHETLLLPYDDKADLEGLRHLVQFVNCSEVPVTDRLSKRVYIYKRSENRIVIAS